MADLSRYDGRYPEPPYRTDSEEFTELQAQLDAVTRERDALKAKLERLRPGVLYCYNTDGKNLEFFNAVKEVYGQEVTETRVEVPRE